MRRFLFWATTVDLLLTSGGKLGLEWLPLLQEVIAGTFFAAIVCEALDSAGKIVADIWKQKKEG